MNQPRVFTLHPALRLLLIALIGLGMFLRLAWTNWSQDANLHPDEYGMTNTLTRLSIPKTLAEYFNTRLSPLSPYPSYDEAGQKLADGADNRLRWGQLPLILLRAAGEWSGNSGYGEQRLLGRTLSALADCLTLLLTFLIGRRLYGSDVGLLGAALSALAVMQIQQSHFMTVDNFAVLFTMLALYAAVRAAQSGLTGLRGAGWYGLFGVFFGMALASRINLAPLAGMIALAAVLQHLPLMGARNFSALRGALVSYALLTALAAALALLTFRVTQPMSFRAPVGDTGFFTLALNPDWTDSMKVAQLESSGIGGGPPGEQWAHRPAIIFPLINMLLWGMGLPLGMAAWGGFGMALARSIQRRGWQMHLLPLVWVGGYFLFMGTRWVKSVRYFLPIYPMLCLLAAWALVEIWRSASASGRWRRALAGLAGGVVVLGTLVWAGAFVRAVYLTENTRVQATRWLLHNLPAPFMLELDGSEGRLTEPLPAPDGLLITPETPYSAPFILPQDAALRQIRIAHAQALDAPQNRLRARVTSADGSLTLAESELVVLPANRDERGEAYQADFSPVALRAGETYNLVIETVSAGGVAVMKTVLANENWDEGLPFPFEGRDPFGGLYRGLTLEVRWADSVEKKTMFLETLERTDYVILPSQRAIWSVNRIPRTYPMTMAYYRALFDGRLGFELVAAFQSPLQIGAVYISDVGGRLGWGAAPDLPLFNYSWWAAEEAFSVYDHPPVWVFRKRADFNLAQAAAVLDSIDLDTVIVEGPREAEW